MCGYEYSGLAKILNVFESEHFRLPRRTMKVLRETDFRLLLMAATMSACLRSSPIKKTAAHGIALVSVTDAWMSGRGAYYVEMIAKHGVVAIHTASSSPLVAPPGGIRPVLGTNPIAIAVPSSRGPIVPDMGTSAYMMTEVMLREMESYFPKASRSALGASRPGIQRRHDAAPCCRSVATKVSGSRS
jgi:hypothetical protein